MMKMMSDDEIKVKNANLANKVQDSTLLISTYQKF